MGFRCICARFERMWDDKNHPMGGDMVGGKEFFPPVDEVVGG